MLVIRSDLVEKIMAHARAEQRDEACGMIAAAEGSERPERHIRMTNAAKHWASPVVVKGQPRSAETYFDFEPAEKLAAYQQMDRLEEWPVVVYHSHTHTEAYPSDVDIDIMSGPLSDPRTHWVIVSTRVDAPPTVSNGYEFRSFRVEDTRVVEEPVEVVESYMFAHTGSDDVPDRP